MKTQNQPNNPPFISYLITKHNNLLSKLKLRLLITQLNELFNPEPDTETTNNC